MLDLLRSGPFRPAAFALLIAAAWPVAAQYKVVGPDGKVTYTDRPPPAAVGKVTNLQARNAPAVTETPLPLELREATTKYPATLYTTSGACDPCEGARRLLRQRGVPYAERQVVTTEDNEALARITGGREVPVLTLGTQTVKGFASDAWVSYLDAAGYPKESKLPPTYQYPAPAPIVPPRVAAPAAPEPAAAPTPAPAPAGNQPPIRF